MSNYGKWQALNEERRAKAAKLNEEARKKARDSLRAAGGHPSRETFDSSESDDDNRPGPSKTNNGNTTAAKSTPKTPVKRGAGGPTPDNTPTKKGNMNQDDEEMEDAEQPFAAQASSSKAGRSGTMSENNPNNVAKVSNILRPLPTPDYTVTFVHQKEFILQPFLNGSWAQGGGPGTTWLLSPWQVLGDNYLGWYMAPHEINHFFGGNESLRCWNSYQILNAGWKIKRSQLFSLNQIDPGAPKYINSNNQDPDIFVLSDEHDIPAHWETRTIEGGTLVRSAIENIMFDGRRDAVPMGRATWYMPTTLAAIGQSRELFPFDRLTRLDKESFTDRTVSKNTWSVPLLPHDTTSGTNTVPPRWGSTYMYNPDWTGASTSGGSWLMTSDQRQSGSRPGDAANSFAMYAETPVGPIAFQDWSTINPHTNLPSPGGKKNTPCFYKMQQIINPDNTLVDNRIQFVVETTCTLKFKLRGYTSTESAVDTEDLIFNKLAHTLRPPPGRNSQPGLGQYDNLFMRGLPTTIGGTGYIINQAYDGYHGRSTNAANNGPLNAAPPPNDEPSKPSLPKTLYEKYGKKLYD